MLCFDVPPTMAFATGAEKSSLARFATGAKKNHVGVNEIGIVVIYFKF